MILLSSTLFLPLKERGIDGLFESIQAAYNAAMIKMPTPKITRVLQSAIERQQPPRAGLVRPKMRYAHQGGMNPPVIVVHGNSLHAISDSYTRYLTQTFRKAFNLQVRRSEFNTMFRKTRMKMRKTNRRKNRCAVSA